MCESIKLPNPPRTVKLVEVDIRICENRGCEKQPVLLLIFTQLRTFRIDHRWLKDNPDFGKWRNARTYVFICQDCEEVTQSSQPRGLFETEKEARWAATKGG